MMNSEQKVCRLNDIYLHALSDESDSAFLHQMLFDKDYRIRSKAFYVAEVHCDDKVREALFEILCHEEREWQLRALSVLCRNPSDEALPYLERCLFQRAKPLLIRGALLTLAETGGEKASRLFARFLLSPFSGYLKDDFLTHCLMTLVERTPDGRELWTELETETPALSALSAALCDEGDTNELLMVYPYPDYLSRMAEKQGIDPKEWKRVSFFPRKKVGRRKQDAPKREG